VLNTFVFNTLFSVSKSFNFDLYFSKSLLSSRMSLSYKSLCQTSLSFSLSSSSLSLFISNWYLFDSTCKSLALVLNSFTLLTMSLFCLRNSFCNYSNSLTSNLPILLLLLTGSGDRTLICSFYGLNKLRFCSILMLYSGSSSKLCSVIFFS